MKEKSTEEIEQEKIVTKTDEFQKELDSVVLVGACPFVEGYISKIERETLKKLKEATNLRDAEIIVNLGKYRINLMADLVNRCEVIPKELESKKEEGEQK